MESLPASEEEYLDITLSPLSSTDRLIELSDSIGSRISPDRPFEATPMEFLMYEPMTLNRRVRLLFLLVLHKYSLIRWSTLREILHRPFMDVWITYLDRQMNAEIPSGEGILGVEGTYKQIRRAYVDRLLSDELAIRARLPPLETSRYFPSSFYDEAKRDLYASNAFPSDRLDDPPSIIIWGACRGIDYNKLGGTGAGNRWIIATFIIWFFPGIYKKPLPLQVKPYTGRTVTSGNAAISLIRQGYRIGEDEILEDVADKIGEELEYPDYPPVLDYDDIVLLRDWYISSKLLVSVYIYLGIPTPLLDIMYVSSSLWLFERGYFPSIGENGTAHEGPSSLEVLVTLRRLSEEERIALALASDKTGGFMQKAATSLSSPIVRDRLYLAVLSPQPEENITLATPNGPASDTGRYIDRDTTIRAYANSIGMVIPPEMDAFMYFFSNIKRYGSVLDRPANMHAFAPIQFITGGVNLEQYTDQEIMTFTGLYPPYISREFMIETMFTLGAVYVILSLAFGCIPRTTTVIASPSGVSSVPAVTIGTFNAHRTLNCHTVTESSNLPLTLRDVHSLDIYILSQRFPLLRTSMLSYGTSRIIHPININIEHLRSLRSVGEYILQWLRVKSALDAEFINRVLQMYDSLTYLSIPTLILQKDSYVSTYVFVYDVLRYIRNGGLTEDNALRCIWTATYHIDRRPS